MKLPILAGIIVSQLLSLPAQSQKITLKQKIEKIIAGKKAVVGVAIGGVDDRDTITVNGAGHYPMQSTYKFHLALAVLDQVDKGKFSINQKISVKKSDLLPGTWSPLRDAYPEGEVSLPLKDIIRYSVAQSDNNACDILFRLMGGPKEVNRYIHALAIRDLNIALTEEDANKSWEGQYNNWSTPIAAVQLLKKFHEKAILSQKSHDLLWDMMTSSIKNNRLKGALPEGTIVGHKTGTSGTNAQNVMAAVNDMGIIETPDGKHFSIAVFVSETSEGDSLSSNLIAAIAKTAFEHYAEKELAAARVKFDYTKAIDELVATSIKEKRPFNGTILISQNGRRLYSKLFGMSDMDKKTALLPNDQYVIGSISKQVTAVLVLQEVEKGHIMLHLPIKTYLPELNQPWADVVTVHQLLTHTHGITALDKPLSFTPGNDFEYSQLGYDLLARIVEKTGKKTFALMAAELFERCNMRSTFHPDLKKHKNLVKGYTTDAEGKPIVEAKTFDTYPAAGGFISTPNDLLIWNTLLHTGKLFSDSSNYKKMITGYATRNHPVFGPVDYGYGITNSTKDDYWQLGQTGFVPGFVSMDFYYPQTKTSVIILSNVARDTADLPNTFQFHTQVLDILKQSTLIEKQ